MFHYNLDKYQEKLFGYNFSLLMRAAAKLNPIQAKYGNITLGHLEDAFFQHKGTEKRNLIVFFSDDAFFTKYIRLSYVGNYYFGVRINVMHFIKTFLTKEKNERKFSANKYIYSYMMKNSFRNSFMSDMNFYYFESRFKFHRKTHDLDILIDKKRRDEIINNLNTFLNTEIETEKGQFELVKLFLKIKKAI